jgi:hypothetical protein
MLRHLTLLLVFALVACRPDTPATPTADTLLNINRAPASLLSSITAGAGDATWLESRIGGTTVGIWKPLGWTAVTRGGLTLLQHTPSIAYGVSSPENGIIVHIFQPQPETLPAAAHTPEANEALSVLNSVFGVPAYMGDAHSISPPVPFTWRTLPAAYYLAGDSESWALVLGVDVPDTGSVVVINLSMPPRLAGQAEQLLPALFRDFTVDGVQIGSDGIAELPMPLPFPGRETAQPRG